MTDRETWAEQRERLRMLVGGNGPGTALIRAALARIDALEAENAAALAVVEAARQVEAEWGLHDDLRAVGESVLSATLARFDALRGGGR